MPDCVGITIGPILETLQLAETPAALWYASSCFSELTRRLLQEITGQLPDARIISPYYDSSEYTDGVGRYHDRILLETDFADRIEGIVATVKSAMVEMVLSDVFQTEEQRAGSREYLNNYFQIHYVTIPKEQISSRNMLIEMTPLLDAIECMPRCNPSRGTNPFKALFAQKSEDTLSRNARIKASALLQNVTDSQLLNQGNRMKAIEDICGDFPRFKKSNYYAIVSADGDGMSSFFSKMNDADVAEVSKKCFAFAEATAAEVKKFGGMTAYVGGDDLLFLAPVQSADGETVIEFCNRLSDIFSKLVANNQPSPTVSFGIAIRYKQFPLYESLNAAYSALYEAKMSRPEKNTIAVDLQKHSGQCMKLCIAKDGFPLFKRILDQVVGREEETANSVIYVLTKFAPSINVQAKDQRTKNINVFLNNYDSEAQVKYRKYIENIANLFCDHLENSGYITAQTDSDPIQCFEQILRVGKFFTERGSEHA